jgi:hypothetical protein
MGEVDVGSRRARVNPNIDPVNMKIKSGYVLNMLVREKRKIRINLSDPNYAESPFPVTVF